MLNLTTQHTREESKNPKEQAKPPEIGLHAYMQVHARAV